MTKSIIAKRSVIVAGHKTSVSLEPAFWEIIREAAAHRGVTVSRLVSQIDAARTSKNLSSALRLFALDACQRRSGHNEEPTPNTRA